MYVLSINDSTGKYLKMQYWSDRYVLGI